MATVSKFLCINIQVLQILGIYKNTVKVRQRQTRLLGNKSTDMDGIHFGYTAQSFQISSGNDTF